MAVGNRLTAAEYLAADRLGPNTELVRGELVAMSPAGRQHGYICARVASLIAAFAEPRRLGWAMTNDTFVITERDPDTVRGADVAFFTIDALPDLTDDDPHAVPTLVVEVRSPTNRPAELAAKAAEYLRAGVECVVVLDFQAREATIHRSGEPPRSLGADEIIPLPAPLGELRRPVRDWLEQSLD